MVKEVLLPELKEMDVCYMWFQQDGVPAHTARISKSLLRDHFPNALFY